jgi:hypothetical protein
LSLALKPAKTKGKAEEGNEEVSGRVSNKLAREAAKVLERAAFKAIGMALDLDADATEGEFYEAASERLPEGWSALDDAYLAGALDEAKEIFFAEGIQNVIDEAIGVGLLTRGERADAINQAIKYFKEHI